MTNQSLLTLLHEAAGFTLGGSADGEAIYLDRGNADTDWNSLAVFAAGADAFVELEVVPNHGNARQHVGTVADQRCAFDRRGDLAALDQVRFRRREHKLAIGDV